MHLKSTGVTISSFDYRYDAAGNPTRILESSSNRVSLAYDTANQLVRVLDPTQFNYTFVYDAVGNRLKQVRGGTTIFTFTYDAANQLTKMNDGSPNTFTYDQAGNKTGDRYWFMTSTMTWDDENRLATNRSQVIFSPVNRTTLTYTADGLMVGRNYDGAVTKQIWDGQNFLQETDASNVTQAAYSLAPAVYGNLVSMRRLVGSNWTRRYYHYNAIGSTDRLTDEGQAETDRYQMDPFGGDYGGTGTTVNPFRFIGKLGYYNYQSSALVGWFYYVRARHYEPPFGRWASKDAGPSRSLNMYGYSGNAPTFFIDPSGFDHFEQVVVSKSYINTITFVGDMPTPEARIRLLIFADLSSWNPYILDGDVRNPFADGKHRLRGELNISVDAACDTIKNLHVSHNEQGGQEGPLVFGTVNLSTSTEYMSSSSVRIKWKVWGRPNLVVEPAFQTVYPRISVNIWHEGSIVIAADGCTALFFVEKFDGSDFPSHRLWLGPSLNAAVLVRDLPQGAFSSLWRSDGDNQEFVTRDGTGPFQGQRTLSSRARKDFRQEAGAPVAAAHLHAEAGSLGMLLHEAHREPPQPR